MGRLPDYGKYLAETLRENKKNYVIGFTPRGIAEEEDGLSAVTFFVYFDAGGLCGTLWTEQTIDELKQLLKNPQECAIMIERVLSPVCGRGGEEYRPMRGVVVRMRDTEERAESPCESCAEETRVATTADNGSG